MTDDKLTKVLAAIDAAAYERGRRDAFNDVLRTIQEKQNLNMVRLIVTLQASQAEKRTKSAEDARMEAAR